MISPKYALSHYYFKSLSVTPKNVVNLYLDYNCPFSAKMFFTLTKAIPEVEKQFPDKFQFVFVNVVQPWHPQSTLLHEYSFVIGQLLRQQVPEESNLWFWKVSYELFANKEKFYDSVTANIGRNDFYAKINDVVFNALNLPISKEETLAALQIKETDLQHAENGGNIAAADVKYFTRYARGLGIHFTPTVSVNGIVAAQISSSSTIEEFSDVLKTFI